MVHSFSFRQFAGLGRLNADVPNRFVNALPTNMRVQCIIVNDKLSTIIYIFPYPQLGLGLAKCDGDHKFQCSCGIRILLTIMNGDSPTRPWILGTAV
jgi:hypothetical protein